MKRILFAEAIVLLALCLALFGFFLLGIFGVLSSGRDPQPLMLLSAVALVGASFAASYFLELTPAEHALTLLPWMILLYGLVSFGTGTVVPDAIVVSWFSALATTLSLPWILGALLGVWARRLRRREREDCR